MIFLLFVDLENNSKCNFDVENDVFRSASPLAQLYGTSVMEHHHFDHCIMIIHSSVSSFYQDIVIFIKSQSVLLSFFYNTKVGHCIE